MEKDFEALITKHMRMYDTVTAAEVSLHRGSATIPLIGIDVPFHSSYLRPRMQAFKDVLEEMLGADCFKPSQLVGRYIPNLTGTPFSISRDYFEEVWSTTRSNRIRQILDDWESWMERAEKDRELLVSSSYHVNQPDG